jgi:phage shock protein C
MAGRREARFQPTQAVGKQLGAYPAATEKVSPPPRRGYSHPTIATARAGCHGRGIVAIHTGVSMNQALMRSSDGKIAGVCGGLAQWLGVDPTALRVVWLLGTCCTAIFPGFALYVLLWIMMPGPDSGAYSSGHLGLSDKHSMVAGVCGGFADWLGWDPSLVRIFYIVFSICSAAFPGVVAYVLLWLLMSRKDETQGSST